MIRVIIVLLTVTLPLGALACLQPQEAKDNDPAPPSGTQPSTPATPTSQPTATTQPVTKVKSDAPDKNAAEEKPVDWFKVHAVSVSAGETLHDGVTYFVGDKAAEFPLGLKSGLDTVYDLKEESWLLANTGEVVTLEHARNKVAEQAEVTRSSFTDETSPELRQFVEALLDPQFDIQDSENELRLSNDILEYRATSTQKISADRAKRFFLFLDMQAYRKAALPPFSALAYNAELRRLNMLPSISVHKGRTLAGAESEVTTTTTIENVPKAERKQVQAAMRAATKAAMPK